MLQSYISPLRFTNGGFGIDTSGLTSVALRNTLVRATSLVDTYCGLSLIPNKTDFRGGTITDEQHGFPISSEYGLDDPKIRRVYPTRRPVRSITAFEIMFTASYRITLDAATDLFINNQAGYVEIVASQPTIIGFPPVGYWFGLWQPVAQISYTYGWRFPVVGDSCEAVSPTQYLASYGNWDPDDTVTVYGDGLEIDPGDYTLDYDDGSITFTETTMPDPDVVVTVDYTNTLPDALAQGVGVVATDIIGQSRIAQRGMTGLSSLRVAEVTITAMRADQYVTRNGVTVPAQAAALLDGYSQGSVGAG
jgi:hypothetical protein